MDLAEILKTYHEKIVDEWIYRLHTEVSERYCGRPDRRTLSHRLKSK